MRIERGEKERILKIIGGIRKLALPLDNASKEKAFLLWMIEAVCKPFPELMARVKTFEEAIGPTTTKEEFLNFLDGLVDLIQGKQRPNPPSSPPKKDNILN